jgi:hypothetical protein
MRSLFFEVIQMFFRAPDLSDFSLLPKAALGLCFWVGKTAAQSTSTGGGLIPPPDQGRTVVVAAVLGGCCFVFCVARAVRNRFCPPQHQHRGHAELLLEQGRDDRALNIA